MTRNRKYALNQSPLYKLQSRKRLAELLHLDFRAAGQLAKASHGLYRCWDDTNEKGKTRHIENPRPKLKQTQRRIVELLNRISTPGFLTCPVKGMSYIANAACHRGATEVRNLDISSYFTSSHSRRVYWFFSKVMLCSQDVAGMLTALSTFSGHLPTGSPLSPILAFYAHFDMWCEIAELVRGSGCTLTVYMDDITISGSRVPELLIWQIKKVIHTAGLRTKRTKEKHYRNGKGGLVTGVFLKGEKLLIPNAQHQKAHLLRRQLMRDLDQQARENLISRLRSSVAQQRQILAYNTSTIGPTR